MSFIIVSSRCPHSHDRIGAREVRRENVGGVATALRRAISKYGGEWICWGDGKLDSRYIEENDGNYRISRVILTAQEKHGFYDLYSNRTLWPLFHYFRERVLYGDNGFDVYRSVNEKFAERIIRDVKDDDVIWIHDYQLTLVPGILRSRGIKNRIIFTWHIPWVAKEVFETLPQSNCILESLENADIITFHTATYRKNYESLFAERPPNHVYAIPLGIDNRYFEKTKAAPMNSYILNNKKIIFSIDRLDYTKGLVSRVKAVENLIRKHAELSGKFVYIMIVTPSRTTVSDYILMKHELEMNIGRVNGEFGGISWMPILYMYRKISDRSLISYYRTADVALITPIIDGLNLVSKEFVASTEKGILIISKFAGAAQFLDGGITVNPNNLDEVADAIYRALNMKEGEIQERLKSMKREVEKRNTDWWIKRIAGLASKYKEPVGNDIKNE